MRASGSQVWGFRVQAFRVHTRLLESLVLLLGMSPRWLGLGDGAVKRVPFKKEEEDHGEAGLEAWVEGF